MSYCSESTFPLGTRIQDVREFVLLLGFKKGGILKSEDIGKIEEYYWFEDDDYKSWTAVELSIYRNVTDVVVVETRTSSLRSYFDLKHQNRTISSLRKRFGGKFRTDEGVGRYLRVAGDPPPPAASGCFLAFHRFGGNLIKAKICHESRQFPNYQHLKQDRFAIFSDYDPRIVANNALVPFLVAASEDYFKSTFVALLRYSSKKEAFYKTARLQGEQLLAVSDRKTTVEEQVAESLPFQRLAAICRHFNQLDPKLDLAGALRKPYRRRSQSLFESIELLVSSRHEFIHRAAIDSSMTDPHINDVIYDLDAAIERVYRRITLHYGWFYERTWWLGRKSLARTRPEALPLHETMG